MASVLNPDNGEFRVLGTLTANSISNSGSQINSKIRLDSTDDIDLNNIPVNYAAADVALNVQGGSYIGGNQYVGGTFVANGDVVTLGNAGGSLTLNSNIASDILPSTDVTYNVGSPATSWKGVYSAKYFASDMIDTVSTISLDYTVDMVQAGATQAAVSMPDATEDGFIKVIMAISTPTAPVVVTPSTSVGWSTLTFANEGESATLMYKLNVGWIILSTYRASVTV
jgi:hypothetical protein